MNFKKITTMIAALVLAVSILPVQVHADEDFSDTSYWTDRCTNIENLKGKDKQVCETFVQQMASQSSSMSDRLTEIDSQRTEIAKNIEAYEVKIKDLKNQVSDLKGQINDLQGQIDEMQKQIDAKQAKADDLEKKVMGQIENSQSMMRLSKIVDVLMGAKTFTDFVQILNGLSDMTKYNDKTRNDLIAVMQDLEASQKELKGKQEDLQGKQEDALVSQYQAEVIQEEYEAQKKDLDKQYSELQLSKEALAAQNDKVLQAQEEAKAQAAAEEAARRAEEARKEQEALQQQQAQQQQQQQNNNTGNGNAGGGTPSGGGAPSTGGNASVDALTMGAQVVNYAMQFVGYPYIWGAMNPSVGFDCSGLTAYVYGHFGIYLAHSSYAQESAGRIVSYAEAIPGDLITWNGHAGIYIGNGYCVNAMNPEMGVRTCPLSWITNGNMLFHRMF